MLIKRIDYLSPPITFYHQGLLYHSSIVSGILSIISIILIILLTVYYSMELIEKKNPKSFSYYTFIEDSGIFPMNASSLFHFISVASKENDFNNDGIDFSLFRIIGLEDYFEIYLNDNNLSHYNHWIYGKCNSVIDTEGLGNLIQYDFFERSACIRKYFNKEEQKYYDIGDSKFKWPIIAHGTFSENVKLYNIIAEKCEESTLNLILGEGHQCKNTSNFQSILNNNFFGELFIYIINHSVDISNYTNPYKKYIEMVGNVLFNNYYSVNHINFNPSIIRTYNGLIYDKFNEEYAPIYERHEVYSFDKEKTNIYSIFVIWLKNKLYKNERSYKKLQDVISSVGGIYQSITIIAAYINAIYNKFIVLSDTEVLLHSVIHSEKQNNENKKNEYKNEKNPKLKELNNDKIKNDATKTLKKERFKTEKSNKNKKIEKDKKVKDISYMNNNIFVNKENINISTEKLNYKDIKKFRYNDTTKKLELTNFLYYLIFLITCRKKKQYFNFYREFRMKIISEEHLIRNHLNIYNLLRVTERKRNYKRNSYQLNDLIKLI
jgi:hypothetical protein